MAKKVSLVFVLFCFTILSVTAQSDSTTKINDSVNSQILIDYNKKLQLLNLKGFWTQYKNQN